MNKYADYSKQGQARKQLFAKVHVYGRSICAKKRAYETEGLANKWLSSTGNAGRPYKCKLCHLWHATKIEVVSG